MLLPDVQVKINHGGNTTIFEARGHRYELVQPTPATIELAPNQIFMFKGSEALYLLPKGQYFVPANVLKMPIN